MKLTHDDDDESFDDPPMSRYKEDEMNLVVVAVRSYFTFPWYSQG